MFLFLQTAAVNTTVTADGNLLDKVALLFREQGVYTSVFAFFLVVVIVLLYKGVTMYFSKENQKREDELNRIKEENLKLQKDKAVADALEVEKPTIKPIIDIKEFKDLTKHPFFVNIQYLLDVKLLETPTTTSENKKNILIDFLYSKFKTHKEIWHESISSIKPENLTPDELKSILINTHIECLKETDRKIERLELPELAMSSMKDYTNLSDKLIYSCIESFCDSEIFVDSFDIIYIILDYKLNLINVLTSHLQLNLEKLNGQLEKTPYKSKIKNL